MKKTKWMLLLIGGLSGIVLAAALVQGSDLQPMVVNNLTGDLRIQQGIPCDDDVDQTTPVTQGRLEIAPAQGVDVPGGKFFMLTRVSVSFAPFSIHRSCLGFGETRSYTAVGVQLGQAVSFTASAAGAGVYAVTIPKDDFLIYEAATVNGKSEAGHKHPSEDVTGTIDLGHGTVQMRVVVATKVHFEAGCAFGHCVIDENKNGSLTATLSGSVVLPDTDHDGVPDGTDNCRLFPNPDQSPVATPVVTAPPSVTLASCLSHQIGVAGAVDVCEGRAVTVTNNAPGTFAIGANLVTWSGNDGTDPVVTATQHVTIVDTTPPIFTFIPPDITMNDCKAANLGVPTATDDCAGTPTFTNNAPAIFLVGATPVTWTAHDVSHNAAIATQMVTVHDTVPPAVSCTPTEDPNDDDHHDHDGHDHDGHGHPDIDDGFFRVFAHDACGAPAIRLGGFTLAKGEVIKIEQSHKPGIKFLGEKGHKHIKHFQVGPGQNVIAATDGSGNVASISCVVPREHGKDDRQER